MEIKIVNYHLPYRNDQVHKLSNWEKIALLFHTIQNKSEKKYSCYDDAYMYLTVKNLN